MENFIVIRGHGTISAAGHNKVTLSESYRSGRTGFQLINDTPVGALQKESAALLDGLVYENKSYRGLDWSVLMAIYTARQAMAEAGWEREANVSINIGSSRGATALFEQAISEFQNGGKVSSSTSPVTTLGNISSWVGQDLGLSGAVISHSVTCSTGLQALANGFAWLRSGMAEKFLAGASEAPLTPFTLAQMKSLGIYSDDIYSAFPCRPLNAGRRNTFVLGEGAAVFALEKIEKRDLSTGMIILESVGFGFEQITSKTGISARGDHFKLAIENALTAAENTAVDLIIMHSPGTIAGDYAELNAIERIFENSQMPVLCSQKWITGHALGASACLSLDYAVFVLRNQSYMDFPYLAAVRNPEVKQRINRILITAAGFGGNAAAIVVSIV